MFRNLIHDCIIFILGYEFVETFLNIYCKLELAVKHTTIDPSIAKAT